jgi:hypothetical protein
MTKRFLTATLSTGQKITRTTSNDKLAFAWYASGKVAKGPNAGVVGANSGFSSSRFLATKEAMRHGQYWPNDFRFEVVEVVATEPVKPGNPAKDKPWRIVEVSSAGGRTRYAKNSRGGHLRFATQAEAATIAQDMTTESAERHAKQSTYVSCKYEARK